MTLARRLRVVIAVLALASCLVAPATAATGPVVAARPAATTAPTDVFLGVVAVAQKGATFGKRSAWNYLVTVREVFAGTIKTRRVQVRTEARFDVCPHSKSPLTQHGRLYAFALERRGETLVTGQCTAIKASTSAIVATLTASYGQPRDPVPNAQPRPLPDVVTTNVDPGPPASFTRVATPGFALVVIGVVGLVGVRQVKRRRR